MSQELHISAPNPTPQSPRKGTSDDERDGRQIPPKPTTSRAEAHLYMLLVTYQTLEAPSQDFMSFIELAEVTAHLPDFVEGDSIREFIGCEVYRDPVTARDAGSRLIGAYRLSNLGGHCESGEGVVRLDGAIWMACMRRDQRSRIDIQIKENRFHDR